MNKQDFFERIYEECEGGGGAAVCASDFEGHIPERCSKITFLGNGDRETLETKKPKKSIFTNQWA